jgi:alpha-beta hydrolase superfamily lysophospholipase
MLMLWLALSFGDAQISELRRGVDGSSHVSWAAYRLHYRLPPLASRHRIEAFVWHGKRLLAQRFDPADRPRAVVHLLHGYLEHAGLQWPLVQTLVDAGFAVRLLDLPGHGLSEGPRGHISSMEHYQEVMHLWLADQPRPLRLLGHSNGGAVLMEAMRSGLIGPGDKVVLLAPLLRWGWWRSTGALQAIFGWALGSVPRRFRDTTSDASFRAFRRADPLQIARIPLSWTRAIRRWVNTFEAQTNLLHAPVILQGRADKIVDWRANHLGIGRVFPKARFHFYKGARHHLQGEASSIRKKVMAMVLETFEGDL